MSLSRCFRIIDSTDRADRDIYDEHTAMVEATQVRNIDALLVAHEPRIGKTAHALENRLQFDP